MGRIDEAISKQFSAWERRGRGWQVWPFPVPPEPPFRCFRGFRLPEPDPDMDDGCKPTFLSSLVQILESRLNPKPTRVQEEREAEPEPEPLERESLVELQVILPADIDVRQETCAAFLRQLKLCSEPIAFELVGVSGRVTSQFAAHPDDVPILRRQLQAFFPEAVFVPREGQLEAAWDSCTAEDSLVVEFGLAREFMLPLSSGTVDPFIGIVGALSELKPDECALFQVLFQAAEHPWAESMVRSVTGADDRPVFVNAPELTEAAEAKASQSIYAALVRIALRTQTFERTTHLARELAASLSVFANPEGNELIPLHNGDYPFEEHIEDMLRRQSRRSGMLLTSDELIGFVHLPGSAIRSPAFTRQTGKTKAAPATVRQDDGLLLGNNEHAGETVVVRLTPEQRVRHCHIIGASGTGKSTLLFNLIRQDIENGEGVAVLDPHGDLIDRVLGVIPSDRIEDVVLVDPSDPEYSVGFNILSAHSDLEKNLLASDLVAVFQRLSTSWGDQMNSVLQNAILAFLESDRRGTIADVRRFLIEPAYRNEFLKSIRDSDVAYYWQKSFPHLAGNKSIGSILTRLDTLLAQKPIRHMVSQPENRLDFAHIMDSGKIFLAKLPEGLLGRENSYLLGALLVAKFQQIAMSRQAQQIASRRDFWLYIDEFANFITPSMAEILSGARKYRIGLTLAHHELQQLQRSPDVASAVMTHPYTRIVFRVGDEDARKLADGFSYFEARDLRNLEVGQAVCRVERSDYDFNLSVPLPEKRSEDLAAQRRNEVITASRKKYGMARADVEAMLAKSRTPPEEPPASPPSEPAKPKPPPPAPTPTVPELPKATKIPKGANSETKIPEPAAPKSVAEPVSKPPERREPRDLGRGGAQHKALQQRLKQAAEEFGFRSTIEHPVPGSKEGIDLFVERGDQKIACEIPISTTVDHEVGNVLKCLRAGIAHVAVVCIEQERLHKIAAAVSASLGAEASARVSYYDPETFIRHLKALPYAPEPAGPKLRKGYKVKSSFSKLSAEERVGREAVAIKSIAEALKKKR